MHKKSWAVIDRPYSLGCTTVGALYERPRFIFSAKPVAANNRLKSPLAKPVTISIDPGKSTELVLKLNPIGNARIFKAMRNKIGGLFKAVRRQIEGSKKGPAMTAGPVISELPRDREIDYGEPIRFEQTRPVPAGPVLICYLWA